MSLPAGLCDLHLTLIAAQDLRGADVRGTSDAYCKFYFARAEDEKEDGEVTSGESDPQDGEGGDGTQDGDDDATAEDSDGGGDDAGDPTDGADDATNATNATNADGDDADDGDGDAEGGDSDGGGSDENAQDGGEAEQADDADAAVDDMFTGLSGRTEKVDKSVNPELLATFPLDLRAVVQAVIADPDESARIALHVEVWDWDRFTSDDYLGAARVPLADLLKMKGGLLCPLHAKDGALVRNQDSGRQSFLSLQWSWPTAVAIREQIGRSFATRFVSSAFSGVTWDLGKVEEYCVAAGAFACLSWPARTVKGFYQQLSYLCGTTLSDVRHQVISVTSSSRRTDLLVELAGTHTGDGLPFPVRLDSRRTETGVMMISFTTGPAEGSEQPDYDDIVEYVKEWKAKGLSQDQLGDDELRLAGRQFAGGLRITSARAVFDLCATFGPLGLTLGRIDLEHKAVGDDVALAENRAEAKRLEERMQKQLGDWDAPMKVKVYKKGNSGKKVWRQKHFVLQKGWFLSGKVGDEGFERESAVKIESIKAFGLSKKDKTGKRADVTFESTGTVSYVGDSKEVIEDFLAALKEAGAAG